MKNSDVVYKYYLLVFSDTICNVVSFSKTASNKSDNIFVEICIAYICALLNILFYQNFNFQKQNVVAPENTTQVPTLILNKMREKSSVLSGLQKRVFELKQHYLSFNTISEHMICYNRSCRAANKSSVISSCYSPLCLRHVNVRNELLMLLRKMNVIKTELGGKLLKLKIIYEGYL